MSTSKRNCLRLMSVLPMVSACRSKQQPLVKPLHPGVFEILGQRFYSERVHTYLIVLEDRILLFDLPEYEDRLKSYLASFQKPIHALLSHGSCGIKDGKRWQKELGVQVHAHKLDEAHPWIRMTPDHLFTKLPVFGDGVQVIHTPGHSAGSVCLLEKTSKSLFTGDTFHGDPSGAVRDFTKSRAESYEDPIQRLESCKHLLSFDFEHVYPFHYHAIEVGAKQALAHFVRTAS